MARNSKNSPSVINWMGSLILYGIPGVNLIFLILSAIFAKSAAKRKFALAGILLSLLATVIIIAAFIAFPEFLAQVAEQLRAAVAAPAPLPEIIL